MNRADFTRDIGLRARKMLKTKAFLTEFAKHLSGLKEFSKVEYEVTIDAAGYVKANVDRLISVSHNSRNKTNLITHILLLHCSSEDSQLGLHGDGSRYRLDLSQYVIGTYKYELSSTGKTRHWRKIS